VDSAVRAIERGEPRRLAAELEPEPTTVGQAWGAVSA
jgi:hypothetical protein